MTNVLLAVIALELAYLCLHQPSPYGRRSPIGQLAYRYERWRDHRRGYTD